MRTRGLWLGILLAGIALSALADTWLLESGKRIQGRLVLEDAETIYVRTADGKTVKIAKADVISREREGFKPLKPVKDYKCRKCWDTGRCGCGACAGTGKAACTLCGGKTRTPCPECSRNEETKCQYCKGRGRVRVGLPRVPGRKREYRERACPACGGTGRRDVKLTRGTGKRPCPRCDGTGRVRVGVIGSGGTRLTVCPTCDGQKTVNCRACAGMGIVVCARCRGSGRDPEESCARCGGTGKVTCACRAAPAAGAKAPAGPDPVPTLDGKPVEVQRKIVEQRRLLLRLRERRRALEKSIEEVLRYLRSQSGPATKTKGPGTRD